MRTPQNRQPDEPDDSEKDSEDDEYGDDELAEFAELNSSTATGTFLDNPWFRRIGIAFAALIAITFLLPLLTPFFLNDNSSQQPDSNLVVLPDFVLPSASGGDIRLSDESERNDTVILVFYRGYF